MQISDERKKWEIDLYFNQHKTYAEIAEIERISPRDIHAIIKEEEARRLQNKYQQEQEEISAKAYDLFSKGKTPVEVAVTLNLREPEVTRLYREYWKLKRLYELNSIYEELGYENIGYFVKLCKLEIKGGYTKEQVVKILKLVDEDNAFGLSHIEKRRKWHIDEIHEFDMQIEKSKKHLHSVNYEIESAKALLNSYHILCERKRQELENINSEASRIVTLVNRFKNNNEEYLKIEKTVEEKVKGVLTDNKQILQFALASIIEALIRNLDNYNNLLVCNASSSSSAIPNQQLPSWPIEGYKDMILDESKELYEKLLKHFTNSIMDNTVSK